MLRCGFLYKRGAFISGWKRRWFTLEGRTLSYYRKQGDSTPAGTIELDESTLAYRNAEGEGAAGRGRALPFFSCSRLSSSVQGRAALYLSHWHQGAHVRDIGHVAGRDGRLDRRFSSPLLLAVAAADHLFPSQPP